MGLESRCNVKIGTTVCTGVLLFDLNCKKFEVHLDMSIVSHESWSMFTYFNGLNANCDVSGFCI